MIKNIFQTLLLTVVVVLASCNKEEGTGGESSINGKVYVKLFNRLTHQVIDTITAGGEDIYISYGSNTTVDDRARIAPDGSFEFKFLTKGNYRLFLYSDDSVNYSNSNISIEKLIKVDGSKSSSAGIIYIYKGLDYNDGVGTIKGRLFRQDVDRIYGNTLSINAANNEDVYLSLNDDLSVLERARTGIDGTFEFSNLIDGNYKIFALSEVSKGNDQPKIMDVTVSGNKITIDSFIIKNGLDVEDGSAFITGKVYVYNFKNDGVTLSSQYWAQDKEVYVIYGDKKDYDIRVRTSYDGSFVIPNLIKGSYKVFVYTAHRNADGDLDGSNEDSIVVKNVTISEEGQKVDLGVINTEKL